MMGLMSFKTIAVVALASSVFAISAEVASAGTVSTACPESNPYAPDDYREFNVEIDDSYAPATCLFFGLGNITGNTTAGNTNGLDPFLASPEGVGYVVIDNSRDPDMGIAGYTGMEAINQSSLNGGLEGWINLIYPTLAQTPVGYEYYDFAIGFKTGVAQLDPDWAIFGLPGGLPSLHWWIDPSGSQALSHTVLYAKLRVSEVPLPASLPLLLGGIGLLGFVGRRRKATTA